MKHVINDAFVKAYHTLIDWGHELVLILPNLLVALVVFIIFYLLGKIVKKLVLQPVERIAPNQIMGSLVVNLVFVACLGIGFLVAVKLLQPDDTIGSWLAGAGIAGLVIGFVFQDMAANLAAGVLLVFRRPVRIDDIIESNGYIGTVTDIRMRTTTLHTFQGQRLLIPNKDIYNKPILNYNYTGRRRIDLHGRIACGQDLRRIKQLVEDALSLVEQADKKEEIVCFFTDIHQETIAYQAFFWIDFSHQQDFLKARSEAIIQIQHAFSHHQILQR